jgi:hypothetical protein
MNSILRKTLTRTNTFQTKQFKHFTTEIAKLNQITLNKKNNESKPTFKFIKLPSLFFSRSQMGINFQLLRKSEQNNPNLYYYDGYVFFELKEIEKFKTRSGFKNERYILFKPRDIARILLIEPKCYVEVEFREKIQINNKNKVLIIENTMNNTYYFTIAVRCPISERITSSSVELTAEDFVILQMYLEVILLIQHSLNQLCITKLI